MIREKLLPVESYAVFDSFTEKALQDGEEGVEQPESLLHAKNWLFYKGRLRRWFFFPNDGIVMFLGPRGPLGTPLSVRPPARKKNLNHL